MLWWIVTLINFGLSVLSGLLAKKPDAPRPSALGDLQAPTAEDGRPIPVVFGTVQISAPNCTWYGDLAAVPIKQNMGWMAFGRTVVTGYKYYLGMELTLCHGPVDEWVGMKAADNAKAVPLPRAPSSPTGMEARTIWPWM